MTRIQPQSYHRTTLANGLRIVTAPRREAESVAVGIWIGVGARYEAERVSGISHFLEHLLFKGSRRYSARRLKTLIEGAGGTLNAFTDEEFTCVWAKVLPHNVSKGIEILTDMTLHPRLEPRELERERQVVMEEIRMIRDQPSHYVHDLLNALLWPGHPLGRDISGTPASLRRIRRDDVRAFQRRHYVPRNAVIAVCGRTTHREVVEAVRRLWSGLKPGRPSKCRRASARQRRPRLRVEVKETEQTHWCVGFHAFPRNHPHIQALALLNVVLGGNMSSRLFQRVRERAGLAYEIGSCLKRYRDTGFFSIAAGVEHKHLGRSLRMTLKECGRLRREPVSSDEFDRAVEYLIGQILFALEDPVEHMCWIGECEMLLGRVEPAEALVDQVLRVKRSDLNRVARAILRREHLSAAVIGPGRPKGRPGATSLLADL